MTLLDARSGRDTARRSRTKGILIQHKLEEVCVDARQRTLSLETKTSWARVTMGTDRFVSVGRAGGESSHGELPFPSEIEDRVVFLDSGG